MQLLAIITNILKETDSHNQSLFILSFLIKNESLFKLTVKNGKLTL